jgi:hypothetical protein
MILVQSAAAARRHRALRLQIRLLSVFNVRKGTKLSNTAHHELSRRRMDMDGIIQAVVRENNQEGVAENCEKENLQGQRISRSKK